MEETPLEANPTDVDLAAFELTIDVRPHARTSPSIGEAVVVGLGDLVSEPSSWISSIDTPVLIVCDIGLRSHMATEHLRSVGYTAVVSLAGGIDAWRAAGLPVTATQGLSPAQLDRYDRHLKLAAVGVPGQRALLDATVAVVGAGGLGSPVIAYLAAAGVGTIRVIDDDAVEASNLQRQPIHRGTDVGSSKTESAERFATGLNPDVTVEAISQRLDEDNARSLLEGVAVVVDASDNFAARYAINDAAVSLQIPVVFASVYAMEGQVAVFDSRVGPCYRCVFPEPPDASVPLDCTTIGVLGSVTGVLGSIQATEAIKLITGAGETLTGKLLLYDARDQSFTTLPVTRDPVCPVCSPAVTPSARPGG